MALTQPNKKTVIKLIWLLAFFGVILAFIVVFVNNDFIPLLAMHLIATLLFVIPFYNYACLGKRPYRSLWNTDINCPVRTKSAPPHLQIERFLKFSCANLALPWQGESRSGSKNTH
jgi:hypothetical protein